MQTTVGTPARLATSLVGDTGAVVYADAAGRLAHDVSKVYFDATNTRWHTGPRGGTPTAATVNWYGAASGSLVAAASVTGDTQPRLTIDASGNLSWGSGSSATAGTFGRGTYAGSAYPGHVENALDQASPTLLGARNNSTSGTANGAAVGFLALGHTAADGANRGVINFAYWKNSAGGAGYWLGGSAGERVAFITEGAGGVMYNHRATTGSFVWGINDVLKASLTTTAFSATVPISTPGGYFAPQATAASTDVFASSVSGDSQYRFVINADGSMEWGSGSAAADLTFARSGAGQGTFTANQNALTYLAVNNSNTGTGASSQIYVGVDAGYATLGAFGTNKTAYGGIPSLASYLYGNMAGGVVLMSDHATGSISFAAGAVPTAQMKMNASGNLGIMPSFTATGGWGAGPIVKLDIRGNDSSAQMLLTRYDGSSASAGALFNTARARGTQAAPAIVQNNDLLSYWNVTGYDGAAWRTAANIAFYVDGTTGAGDMPGRIVFQTTPDGSAVGVDRWIIDNAGNLKSALIGADTVTRFNVDVSGTQSWSSGTIAAPIFFGYAGVTGSTAQVSLWGASDKQTILNIDAHSADAVGGALLGRKSRGTRAAPGSVLSGDGLFYFFGRGYGGNDYYNAAGFSVLATENHSSTLHGGELLIYTVANAAGAAGGYRWRFGQDGHFEPYVDAVSNVGSSTKRIANIWTSGQVLAANGTAAAPAVSFANSTTTGFYRAAADEIGIGIAGAAGGLWTSDGLIVGSATKFAAWNVTSNSYKQIKLGNSQMIGHTTSGGFVVSAASYYDGAAASYKRLNGSDIPAALVAVPGTVGLAVAAAGSADSTFSFSYGVKVVYSGGIQVGFYDQTPVARQTVTGSKLSGAALADLLTKLANTGLIIDGTSA